jgi:cardiolipin synthase A/B
VAKVDAKRILAALVVVGMLAPLAPVAAEPVGHALITAVYYDTYVTNEGDEFVRLHNPTAADLDLAGWQLTDGEGTLTFPAGARLAAGASAYVTGKATDFRLDMVRSPDWEYLADTDPAIPQLARTGTFALANGGDEVRLLDPSGAVVDAVAWGTSPGTPGWTGDVLADVSEGVVLERDTDEGTGLHPDTDAAGDWDDDRLYVVGQTHRAPATFEATGATLYSSPDSTFASIVAFLDAAQDTLDLELYQLTSAQLGAALAARAAAGVEVRLLTSRTPSSATSRPLGERSASSSPTPPRACTTATTSCTASSPSPTGPACWR